MLEDLNSSTFVLIDGKPVTRVALTDKMQFSLGDSARFLFLETDDCQTSYEQLSARGVEFNDPPTAQPYGIDTSFRDPSGNNIRLTQVLEFDPTRT